MSFLKVCYLKRRRSLRSYIGVGVCKSVEHPGSDFDSGKRNTQRPIPVPLCPLRITLGPEWDRIMATAESGGDEHLSHDAAPFVVLWRDVYSTDVSKSGNARTDHVTACLLVVCGDACIQRAADHVSDPVQKTFNFVYDLNTSLRDCASFT
jgi:hypothetical protein